VSSEARDLRQVIVDAARPEKEALFLVKLATAHRPNKAAPIGADLPPADVVTGPAN
jgi:hypothetical protein